MTYHMRKICSIHDFADVRGFWRVRYFERSLDRIPFKCDARRLAKAWPRVFDPDPTYRFIRTQAPVRGVVPEVKRK